MSSFESFENQSDLWWDENGPFALLHKLNPIRLKYIIDRIKDNLRADYRKLKAIDIGCGGGILTMPLARLGMEVHGLDPGQKNIEVAKEKSHFAELNIQYYATHLENIASLDEQRGQYDIVTSMEVVEHVDDYKSFLMDLCKLLKPNGLLFISSINRTIKSFAEAIIAAEYLLSFVPKGTHEWNKFLKPSEVASTVADYGLSVIDISGVKLNPLTKVWSLSHDTSVNYMMCFKKK